MLFRSHPDLAVKKTVASSDGTPVKTTDVTLTVPASVTGDELAEITRQAIAGRVSIAVTS